MQDTTQKPSNGAASPTADEESPSRGEFRRELRSLALVYIALTVLPLLTGFACQG